MRGTIYDPLRKKEVALTPEEEVRQFFMKWLQTEKGYPPGLMASEYTIRFNRRCFRCDIVVFNRNLEPIIIVECKSPEVKLSNRVLEQAVTYNMVLKVPHLIITNGESTVICSYDNAEGKYAFTDDIPPYSSR